MVVPGAPGSPGLRVVVDPDQKHNKHRKARLQLPIQVYCVCKWCWQQPSPTRPKLQKTKARLQANYSILPHHQFLEGAPFSKPSPAAFEIAV